MPEVSIIVPIYNVEAFLPQCLASIAAQTFKDFECILVDDGSPDGSGALCDEQARQDPRFRVIHQKNGGVSSARNSGMKLSQGHWLVFCDGDDALHPRLLELALETQKLHPQDLIAWRFTFDPADWAVDFPGSDSLSITCFSQSQLLRYFSDRQLFNSPSNKLYPLGFLRQEAIQFNEALHNSEDYDFFNQFWPRFFAGNPDAGICQIDLPLYYYNQSNTGSITHTTGATYQRDFSDYCRLQLRLYAETKSVFEPFFCYPAPDIALVMSATLQSIAYGLCQLPQPRQEIARLWQIPELQEIWQWHRQQRVHNLFLTFLRLRWAGGVKWWFHICETRPALYANVYWTGYRSLRKNES
ncbi:glycosyltransferase family 2 protein [Allofournierella sp.]|uniref:glycosyltransferase family 2 protein n=1 Tax=Allofournierella sp. TaxID=1940256 RepID=UPI003AB1B386